VLLRGLFGPSWTTATITAATEARGNVPPADVCHGCREGILKPRKEVKQRTLELSRQPHPVLRERETSQTVDQEMGGRVPTPLTTYAISLSVLRADISRESLRRAAASIEKRWSVISRYVRSASGTTNGREAASALRAR